MTRYLPLAVVQAAPHPADQSPDPALGDFAAHLQGVLRDFPQTRLVVYPELHLCSGDHAALQALAEPLDGPRVRSLAQLAGDLGLWLVPGSVCERGPAGELFNTALVFSPQGELVASYRKVFPWRPYEPFDPGERFVTFDIAGVGRIGLSVCYDAWFPEVTRQLAWMGAEVVLNLVRTTTVDRAQELVLARANAIVNQLYMVSVNCAAPVGTGQSIIVDPEGLVRAHSPGSSPTVLSDVLDFGAVERVRTFGTAGLTRPWSQFVPGDRAVELPIYGGAIDPETWNPEKRK